MMTTVAPDRLLDACRVLYGHEFDPSFLHQLREGGLRSAWRRRALDTHPDRAPDPDRQRDCTERFIEARDAYLLLLRFLDGRVGSSHAAPASRRHQPHRHTPRPAPRKTRPHPRTGALPRELPDRRLRLGELLYYSGAIPFETMIDAVLWQRRQRERFCEIAIRWGWLSGGEGRRLLAGRGGLELVGEAARRLRLLTETDVRMVVGFQRTRQDPIGAYFLERGVVSRSQLAAALRRLSAHNATQQRHRGD